MAEVGATVAEEADMAVAEGMVEVVARPILAAGEGTGREAPLNSAAAAALLALRPETGRAAIGTEAALTTGAALITGATTLAMTAFGMVSMAASPCTGDVVVIIPTTAWVVINLISTTPI